MNIQSDKKSIIDWAVNYYNMLKIYLFWNV